MEDTERDKLHYPNYGQSVGVNPEINPHTHIQTREVLTEPQAGRPETALTLTHFSESLFPPKAYLFPRSPC